jgi:hypothetical protein
MPPDIYEEARHEISDRQLGLANEDELEEILGGIIDKASTDLAETLGDRTELTEAEGNELLSSIEAWASLTSAVTFAAYAGPPREVGAARFTLPGWAKGVGNKLTDLSKLLDRYLKVAMRAIRAISFTIALTFPWGVSVGLTWE